MILTCTGSLSVASLYRLTFLPIFTDQAVFKISSTEPAQFRYSLKVWSGSLLDFVTIFSKSRNLKHPKDKIQNTHI